MYILAWVKDCWPSNPRSYIKLGSFRTLKEAARARQMTGDLVFNLESGEIEQSQEWLFDWERKDPNCYAVRNQKSKIKLPIQ